MKQRIISLLVMLTIILSALSTAALAYPSSWVNDDYQPDSSLSASQVDGARSILAQRRGLGEGYGAPPVRPPTVRPPPDRPFQVIRQLRCISRRQFSSDQLFGHLQLIRHCQFIGHRQFIDRRPQLFRREVSHPQSGIAMAITDLLKWTVRLELGVRKLFCDNPDCGRRIFTERLPGVVAVALGGPLAPAKPGTFWREIRKSSWHARSAPWCDTNRRSG